MKRKIPATYPVMPNKTLYLQEIDDIWDTGAMTNNGPKVQKLKAKLKEYTKCQDLDLFVNGHAALFLAIKAMGFEKGSEIITSPFTFVSTTNAIVQNGLIPVFGDVDDSYNLNPACIEELITDKTVAVIAPHIFGIPCDTERIEEIANKYNLKVIYDGAQAFGTKINGKNIACFGDVCMFSFHAIKVFNSIEGGMLSYKDTYLHEIFELYRNFGIQYNSEGNDVTLCGVNAKMDEFRAAMGIVNLDGIDDEIAKRKELAKQYVDRISEIAGISAYEYKDNIDYNYAYFPIKVHPEYGMSRDELYIKLAEKGIGTRKLYDVLTCDYSYYKNRGYRRETSYAEELTKICLDLPMYGTLIIQDVDYICDIISGVNK